MADLVTVDNGGLTDYTVLTDEVTDGTLGTGQKQMVGIMDGTVGGTNKLAVDSSGNASVKQKQSSTGTQTSVSASATTVTVLAANSSRVGAAVYNDSTALLYLKCGATASSTSHTVQIVAGGYWEAPYGYTGIIDGIWASATGSARVTEFT